jgi:hypothetical protein
MAERLYHYFDGDTRSLIVSAGIRVVLSGAATVYISRLVY